MRRRLAIIGSGPAGYSAAIYAARAGLAPLVITGTEFGGAIARTQHLENYPGFARKIDGLFLTEEMRQQAEGFGAEIKAASVASADFSARPLRLGLDDGSALELDAAIVATGTAHRKLGLANEASLVGKGVSYCATCDGFFFKGKDVFVVGGGNSAVYETLYLSTICKSVTLVHRRNELKAEEINRRALTEAGNVTLLMESTVEEIVERGGRLAALVIKTPEGVKEFAASALFVSIGVEPATAFLGGALELDAQGYIKCAPDSCATSVEGVFAAGDVKNPRYRQAVIAAASGAQAAMEARAFLASAE